MDPSLKQIKISNNDAGKFELIRELIIEFAQANSVKPQHPPGLLRRFLNDFISSKELIFDLHDEKGRAVVAVLLDRIQNTKNDACLEVLGVRSDISFNHLLPKLVSLIQKEIPKNRNGFQLVLSEKTEMTDGLLSSLGIEEYYDAYQMRAPSRDDVETPASIECAKKDDADELYDLFCQSFAQSLDTSISEAESWKTGFMNNPQSHFYVWKAKDGLLGFAHLHVDDCPVAEIRTIGVRPGSRGRGVGNGLLRHCMKQAKEMGKMECELTVAVQNKSALDLYRRAGFEPTDVYKCFRKALR